jgi:predicted nucleic acid-binding protein
MSDLVLDVSLSCAWCFADEATAESWAILELLQTGRQLALARSHRLTSYDAAYLELALRRGLPLASRDQALQAAARAEGVPLLPS